MTKRALLFLLKYGIGFGLLAWVVSGHWQVETPTGEDAGIGAALARPWYPIPLLLGALFATAGTFITFVRWFVLVRAQQLPFTLRDAVRLGSLGYFLGTFLPGSVGGDLAKAAFLARSQERRTVAVATVVFDRVVGLLGLYSLAVVAGLALWATGWLDGLQTSAHALFVGAAAFAAVLVLALFFGYAALQLLSESWSDAVLLRLRRVPRLGPSLGEAWSAVWMFRSRPRATGLALLLSLLNHVCSVATIYLISTAALSATDVPALPLHFVLVPITGTVQASFPTPGGLGGSEVAYGELYRLLGYPVAHGVLASLSVRALSWVLGAGAYLLFLRLPNGEPGA